MEGSGDAGAAIAAWGAELGLGRRDVTVGKCIAEGSTAEVFAALWEGRPVAVKRLAANEKTANPFVRELGVMSRTQHPNLVRLLGFCHGAGTFDLVLELCRGGSLFQLLHLSEVEVVPGQQLKVARDVAEGMAYLHALPAPVLHGDLKSLNVLLQEPVLSPGDVPLAKVADFGLARMCLPRRGPCASHRGRPSPLRGPRQRRRRGSIDGGGPLERGAYLASCGDLSESCRAGAAPRWPPSDGPPTGTLRWMAPELMAGRADCYLEVDVYAYGMLLYEIIRFKPPFASVESADVRRLVLEGVRPEIDKDAMSGPLGKLTRACWAQEPSRRPTFSLVVGALRTFRRLTR